MKSVLFVIITCLFISATFGQEVLFAEREISDTISLKEKFTIEGIWELESFYYYRNGYIVDSSRLWSGYKQVKMFQDGYVMWTRNVPMDSVEWYGFGTYQIAGDTLTERISYGSHELIKLYQPEHVFIVDIEKNIFQQIDFDPAGNYIFSENYRRLPPYNSEQKRSDPVRKSEKIKGTKSK